MNYVVFDCETTIRNEGNPFTRGNKLCLVGLKDKDGYHLYDIEYTDSPYGEQLEDIKRRIEAADLVVGFNLKFDLHWLMNYVAINVPRVFDCQLAEFLIGNQSSPFPSLDEAASRFDLGSKLNIVATEYWDHGIDTPDIPLDVLAEYLERDVLLTEGVFLEQRKVLGTKAKLHRIQCADLKVLLEMERNGLKYDFEQARRLGQEAKARIEEINGKLCDLANSTSINWNSSDHISCVLFGGDVYEPFRESYVRFLKDGTPKLKERWSERPISFSGVCRAPEYAELNATKSLSNEELDKVNRGRALDGKKPIQRIYSVAEPILRRVKAKGRRGKELISLLLERSKLEKLYTTYYTGLADKMEEFGYEPNTIHGQFNQVVAVTGRLSSSKPNLQNFAEDIKGLFYSRYNECS